jgi:hypothetical protein
MLVHTVLFYFKPEVTEARIEACASDARNLLTKIETVKELYIGSPADTEVRPVSVLDFGLSLTVIFESLADHNSYQAHPLHDEFIANQKEIWDKVAVQDAD